MPIYSHPTSDEGIPSSATAALSVPARPKPAPGLFMFGRLTFLDKKVSRCYGCGEALKPGGLIPHPPDDLVVTDYQVAQEVLPWGQTSNVAENFVRVFSPQAGLCARFLPEFCPDILSGSTGFGLLPICIAQKLSLS